MVHKLASNRFFEGLEPIVILQHIHQPVTERCSNNRNQLQITQLPCVQSAIKGSHSASLQIHSSFFPYCIQQLFPLNCIEQLPECTCKQISQVQTRNWWKEVNLVTTSDHLQTIDFDCKRWEYTTVHVGRPLFYLFRMTHMDSFGWLGSNYSLSVQKAVNKAISSSFFKMSDTDHTARFKRKTKKPTKSVFLKKKYNSNELIWVS